MKTCENCPSFLPADNVQVKLGKATGVPMCGRFGYVLGQPGLDHEYGTIHEYMAMNCNAYGDPLPDKPLMYSTQVCEPDPQVLKALGNNHQPEELNTCRTCVNLVRSETVYEEMGYMNDLCRATGKLVIRPAQECKGCPFAKRGTNQSTTAGVELVPYLRPGFRIPTEHAVRQVVAKGNTDIEPSEYPTDIPVTDEDLALGIRAWRLVEPGDDGLEPCALPVFDPAKFTPDERLLVPVTGDDNNPELYIDHQNLLYDFAANCYALGEVLALEGEPGTGKTQFAIFAAWLMQQPHELFAYDSETMVDDMLGKIGIVQENGVSVTRFTPGRIARAVGRPVQVTHDEYNMAENAIKEALRTIFNGGMVMTIDRGTEPVRIPRDPYNFHIVCQNPAWDIRNIGTKQMGMADMDRLSPVYVQLPPESIERHIIRQRCALDDYDISDAKLDLIMKIAADLREYSNQQSVPFTFGIRQTIKVGRKTRWYKVPAAFRKAVLDFYDPAVVEICMQVINTHMPS